MHKELKTITIHYDFTSGEELSYSEGLNSEKSFCTCCLDFFTTFEEADEVIVIKSDGSFISRNELLENKGFYTPKEIRRTHDILKMLKANSFQWKKENQYSWMKKGEYGWLKSHIGFSRVKIITVTKDRVHVKAHAIGNGIWISKDRIFETIEDFPSR